MIFDHRTYKPGSIKAHLDLYAKMGFAPQSRLLGKPVLYGTTEVGDVNSYVHVWAYKDLGGPDRQACGHVEHPEWSAYVKASGELGALIKQANIILNHQLLQTAGVMSGRLAPLRGVVKIGPNATATIGSPALEAFSQRSWSD